jgi:hypothetical protein
MVEIILFSNVVPYGVGEPGREFGLVAIATRNCLLHGTTNSSIEIIIYLRID